MRHLASALQSCKSAAATFAEDLGQEIQSPNNVYDFTLRRSIYILFAMFYISVPQSS